MLRSTLGGLALLTLGAASLGAQVVRGRVTEVASAAPVAGALVSLLGDGSDSALVNVLTSGSGEYAVRALQPGRYRLAVKRIGVKRFVSAPFELGAGETRVIDVPIDAIALTLPQVTVSGLCVTRNRELSRIASLWEEARTALEATQISMRDRLMEAEIARYAAELEPGPLRVLFDWRSDAQVMSDQPFRSMSGDSLSEIGYWRQLPGDSVEYQGPDASAIASNAFLRDHCFSLAPAMRNRPDLVGLAFVPARDRQLPDIAGTIWLDARSFELRFIAFHYTLLPTMPNADQVGGEGHYRRLESGAWIVARWFIRMPQIVVRSGDWPRRQLREEGGAVITPAAASSRQMASITGVFRDSAGRPESGAVIRVIGMHHQVLTGQDGTYRLENVPPGTVSLVAHTVGYDALALLAGSRRITVLPGRNQRVDFRAPNASALRREACPVAAPTAYSRPRPPRGVLRMLMVDSATAVPLPGVRFVVSWPAILENASADSSVDAIGTAMTLTCSLVLTNHATPSPPNPSCPLGVQDSQNLRFYTAAFHPLEGEGCRRRRRLWLLGPVFAQTSDPSPSRGGWVGMVFPPQPTAAFDHAVEATPRWPCER